MVHQERKYATFNYPAPLPDGKTLLTGIRAVDGKKEKRCKKQKPEVYISGFYEPAGLGPTVPFVYRGPCDASGTWFVLPFPSFPGATVISTNWYGPNNAPEPGQVQVVGNYFTVESGPFAIGALFEGFLENPEEGRWTTLIPSSLTEDEVINTIAHSTMGNLVVGNYDTQLIQGKAFLYDIGTQEYFNLTYPDAKSVTAYGIWYNGGSSYTICGGITFGNQTIGFETGYLADWDRKKNQLSNFRFYNYNNDPLRAIITHFDGISTGKYGYDLTGVWTGLDGQERAFFAVTSKAHHGKAKWSEVKYPGSNHTTGNSVLQKIVIGVYTVQGMSGVNGYISV